MCYHHCTCIPPLIHVSQPCLHQLKSHLASPCLSCIPHISCISPTSPSCIPTSFLHPSHLPHLTHVPLLPCSLPVSPHIPASWPFMPTCLSLTDPSCTMPHLPWSCISCPVCHDPTSHIPHASHYLCPPSFPPSHALTSAFDPISPLLFLSCLILSHLVP